MVAVTFLALVVFCYFSGLPLIIPLLVFFFGVHLFLFQKSQSAAFFAFGPAFGLAGLRGPRP